MLVAVVVAVSFLRDSLDCGRGVFRSEVRISNCHGHGFVSGQFHHGTQVHSSHHQTADACMPERMPGDILQLSVLDGPLKYFFQALQSLTCA